MQGVVYIIIETPDSQSRSILSYAHNQTGNETKCHFLLPNNLDFPDLPGSHWHWKNNQFNFEIDLNGKTKEWFLFLSNEIDLANQIESLKKHLDLNVDLKIGRIITFINTNLLKKENSQISLWLDGCAHFSDVFCFSNRDNENAKFLNAIMNRYKKKCYPLENYVLSKTKTPPIERILSPVPRRITHIFDPQDILDPEDSVGNDLYLAKHPNGKRIKIIDPPNWNKI